MVCDFCSQRFGQRVPPADDDQQTYAAIAESKDFGKRVQTSANYAALPAGPVPNRRKIKMPPACPAEFHAPSYRRRTY